MTQSCIPFQHLPKKKILSKLSQILDNTKKLQFVYILSRRIELNEVTQTSVNKRMPNNYMHKDITTYDNKTFILVFYITNLMAAT